MISSLDVSPVRQRPVFLRSIFGIPEDFEGTSISRGTYGNAAEIRSFVWIRRRSFCLIEMGIKIRGISVPDNYLMSPRSCFALIPSEREPELELAAGFAGSPRFAKLRNVCSTT